MSTGEEKQPSIVLKLPLQSGLSPKTLSKVKFRAQTDEVSLK